MRAFWLSFSVAASVLPAGNLLREHAVSAVRLSELGYERDHIRTRTGAAAATLRASARFLSRSSIADTGRALHQINLWISTHLR
jgi:hypothetical protein